MVGTEIAGLKRQLDGLRQAMTDLVQLQRALLLTPRPSEARTSADEPILSQLDELHERLQSLRYQVGEADDEKPRYGEIDVERINIVEPDGSLRMTVSCTTRAPDPIMDGHTFSRQGGNRAGIVFFNEEGDECGGLVFTGESRDGGHEAAGALLFDQFKQDQTIGMQYLDRAGRRVAGFMVWDRPDGGLREQIERYETVTQLPEGPEKTEALETMQAEGMFGAERIFIGKDDQRTATVSLHDLQGNVRLRLAVDVSGSPKLEFLDAAGGVKYSVSDTTAGEAAGGVSKTNDSEKA